MGSLSDRLRSWLLFGVVGGGGIGVLAMIVWVGSFLWRTRGGDEINLPLIIITGVVFLLIVLGLLTFVFSLLGLANAQEALGLPSGSVRAVIALMLVIVFAIVAIFLYSDVSTGGRVLTATIHQSRLDSFKNRVEYIDHVEVAAPAAPPSTAPSAPTPPADKLVSVTYRNPASQSAQDIAKQLIVLLGTLVTAVASFYFGSSSIAAVTKPTATGGPNAKAVTPTNLAADGTAQLLTVTGTNLNNVGAVRLTFDGRSPISGSAVVAGETSVSCKVTIPAGTDHGPWNVVVSDNANNDSTVPNSVTIGTKPAAQ